jgi:hypothetical protein
MPSRSPTRIPPFRIRTPFHWQIITKIETIRSMHSDQPYCDLVTSYWPGDIHQPSQWQTKAATCVTDSPGCNGSQNNTNWRTGSLAVMGHITKVIWRKSNDRDLESWKLGSRCSARYKSVAERFLKKTIINTEKRENSLSSLEVYDFTHFPFFSLSPLYFCFVNNIWD